MNRLRQQQCEIMAEARSCVPRRLLPLVACDLFAGDPLFAGVMTPEWSNEDASFGRSYRTVAHVGFPHHTRDRRLTVVLPRREEVATALHELGHILHWNLQFLAGGWERLPRLEPVNEYAQTNVLEEFAEAWVAWFCSPMQVDSDPFWKGWSQPNAEFFDRLAAGP